MILCFPFVAVTSKFLSYRKNVQYMSKICSYSKSVEPFVLWCFLVLWDLEKYSYVSTKNYFDFLTRQNFILRSCDKSIIGSLYVNIQECSHVGEQLK